MISCVPLASVAVSMNAGAMKCDLGFAVSVENGGLFNILRVLWSKVQYIDDSNFLFKKTF